MDLLALTHACLLSGADTQIESDRDGWVETSRIEVGTEGSCPWVDIVLPRGVTIQLLKARTRLADGTKHAIGPERQRRIVRDVTGRGALRLYTPDLIPDDRLELRLQRHFPSDGYEWTAEGGFASTNTPSYEPLSEGATATVEIELVVPGDPMRSLYPGGGSSSRTNWSIHLPDPSGASALVVPIPLSATEVEIEGPHLRWDDSVLIWAEAPVEHRISYLLADAPAYGERLELPGTEITQTVRLDGGRIRWQDQQTWWIGAIGTQPIVPERSRLIRALEKRFRRAAIPEPALPSELRGRPGDWELVTQLKPALAARAGVADLSVAPLFPRRLIKARRSGALTSVEAALTLWVQATQAQLQASWAIVMPANRGNGWHTSPAGYDVGLVAVNFGGTVEWIDPGCAVCAPFEIRPDLEGAAMLSPIGLATPPPTPGTMHVVDSEGHRTVQLTGPAALTLRLWLAEQPKLSRSSRLAERFGGVGAELISAAGLASPGEAITIEVRAAALPDPLTPPPDDWWIWIGERVWTYSATESEPQHVHRDGLCWTRRSDGSQRTERLWVAYRQMDRGASQALHEQRRALEPDVSVP